MSTVRGAFDPETLAMLRGVFDEACLALTPEPTLHRACVIGSKPPRIGL